MFSEPAQNNQTLEKYNILLDGEKLNIEDTDNNIFPYMLYENLRLYKNLKDPNYDDIVMNAIDSRFKPRVKLKTYDRLVKRIWNNEETVENFPKWLTNFIAKRTDIKFSLLEFNVEYYNYSNGECVLLKSESILKYEY